LALSYGGNFLHSLHNSSGGAPYHPNVLSPLSEWIHLGKLIEKVSVALLRALCDGLVMEMVFAVTAW
jgi:hypothetical protein